VLRNLEIQIRRFKSTVAWLEQVRQWMAKPVQVGAVFSAVECRQAHGNAPLTRFHEKCPLSSLRRRIVARKNL